LPQFTTAARFGPGCGAPLASVQLAGVQVNGLTSGSVATDDNGEVWLRLRGNSLDRLRRLSPTGVQRFDVPIDGLTLAIAVGTDQRIWTIRSDHRLQLFDQNGVLAADFGTAVAGLSPNALDTNQSGDAWVLNSSGSLQSLRRVNRGGGVVFNVNLPPGGSGLDVAVSPTGEAWVACSETGSNPDTLRKYSNAGVLILTVTLPASPLTRVRGLAVDQFSNVAVITDFPHRLLTFTNNGAALGSAGLPAAAAGITYVGGGNLVVTFPTLNEVRRFTANSAAQCTVARSFGPGPISGSKVVDTFWVATTQLESPVPTLASIAPTSVPAGSSDLSLTLTGSGFGPSRVLWRPQGSTNANVLAATSITTTRIVATVPASLLTLPGTAFVSVENAPLGGGRTPELPLAISGTTGSLTLYGSGCRGSNALVPSLTGVGAPRIGATFTERISNAPAGAPVVLGTGASRTTWLGVPLPANLAAFGAPLCNLLAAYDLTLTAAAASGTATFDLAIPANPEFVGVHVFQQGLVVDAAANALGLAFTQGADLRLGNQ